ncbi:MAG TPA: hypothetical protein VHK24_09250, partial [Steroidobacter sp.]|nr:hypothetical protein [Steroidobacter sp.]
MIGAGEALGIAALEVTDRVGSVRAAVHQHTHRARIIAQENDGLEANPAGAEISRPRNLALVA